MPETRAKCRNDSNEMLLRINEDAIKLVDKRIALCIRSTENYSNCVGTALFITYERDNDWAVSGSLIRNELLHLKQVKDPTAGYIVSWETPHKGKIIVSHMGVVTSIDPILVTHRKGPGMQVIKDQPFDDLNRHYVEAPFFCEYRFYGPRMFDFTYRINSFK